MCFTSHASFTAEGDDDRSGEELEDFEETEVAMQQLAVGESSDLMPSQAEKEEEQG